MEFHISLIGRKDLSGEIYRQLRRAIVDGRLRPTDLLPPSRELARRLGVSRTTVTVAYDRLAGEGFVSSHVGAGTFVSERVPRVSGLGKQHRSGGILTPRDIWETVPLAAPFARPARFDFRSGLPDASCFPHDAWRRLLEREFRSEALGGGVYADPAGHPGLRQAISRHIAISRGVETDPDSVTITNGSQQAIDIIGRILLNPGDCVAVEDPGYPPPRRLFTTIGARVAGVPVDEQGLVVEALPRRARLIYVTPSHQYPLGVSMSLPRRIELLAWAEEHDAAIIEDDYDSEFRFGGRPIEPLQTMDTSGRVIYVGSFSKTLLPTLRLGFMVTPPSLVTAAHKAKQVTDWHTSMAIQAPLARFIDSGGFARHIRKVGGIYRDRHERIVQILARDFRAYLELIPSAVGLHVAAFARNASADQVDAVVQRASNKGVEVQRLSYYEVDTPPRPGLVLGYGAIETSQVEEGLRLLLASFKE
ncbi:MAG: PLP-dependent aminotransferase family protein, partial [Gemmatimonadota bacterium]